MSRDDLIAQKYQALKAELDRWALENSILKTGETFNFSIEIGGYPTAREEVLEMRVMEFFKHERLEHHADDSSCMATRVENSLSRVFDRQPSSTMREFLEEWTFERIMRIRKLGHLGVKVICAALEESGLELRGCPF